MGNPLSFEVQDPNNTAAPDQSAGGKTKIRPTEQSVDSREQVINGADVRPGNGGSEMPKAAEIIPETYGDPNNTAGEFPSR